MIKIFILNLVAAVSIAAAQYSVVEGTFTWDQAREDAIARGGDLASLDSPQAQSKVNELFKKSGKYYWIGATDYQTEGKWRWVNEKNWNYSNWYESDPNNSNNIEHYALIFSGAHGTRKYSGTWLDAALNYPTQGYILEIDTKTTKNILYKRVQPVPRGFSMISIPFSYQGNSISTLFGATSGITIYDYNYFGGWMVNSYDADFEEWGTPNHVLEAGTAVWILNRNADTINIEFEGYQPSNWRAPLGQE